MTQPILARSAVVQLRADAPARSVDVIASTDAEDSYGEIVDQSSWRLERYRANPVVLYAHDSHELPIGHAEDVRVENGQLRMRIVLASADANPRAEQVWKLMQSGDLRGVSVGFRPDTVRVEKRDGREVLVLADCELLELSVVPIPANPEALAQLRARALSPRPKETNMRNVLVALGLSPDAGEADAVSAASDLRALLGVTGAKSAAEARGAIEGLKLAAARADALGAELDALKAKTAEGERAAMLKSAEGIVPPGSESAWAYLRSAPMEGAKAFLDGFPRGLVKTAPEAKQFAAKGAPALTDREKSIAHQTGISEEDFAAEKARRASLSNDSEEV